MKTTIPKTITNKKAAIDLITALTGQANILSIPVEFIRYAGSVDCALLLSQLLYWADKGSRRDGYIWKTYAQWEEEICLSEYKVRKAAKHLKSMGILETDIKKANGNPTVHYRIDLEQFSESFLSYLQERKASNFEIQSEETEESLTEITTETTQETTTERESFYEANSLSQEEYGFNEEDTTSIVSEDKEIPTPYLRKTGMPKAQATLLPEDFQPDDDMLFWAATTFNNISVKDATIKFIAFYRARKIKLADWNAEWRKWMANERPSSNRTEEELSDENFMNRLNATEEVASFISESGDFVLTLEKLIEGLPDLSVMTIKSCLTDMAKYGRVANPAEGHYFDLWSYQHESEFRAMVDTQLEELGIEYGLPTNEEEANRVGLTFANIGDKPMLVWNYKKLSSGVSQR